MGSGDLLLALSHPFRVLRPSPLCTSRTAHIDDRSPLRAPKPLERSRNRHRRISPMPTRPTAYRTRQARAETIGTISNELGIAIAAPFRKALSEPHETDCVAVTANSEAQNHRLGGRRERFWPLGAQKGVQHEDFPWGHPSWNHTCLIIVCLRRNF